MTLLHRDRPATITSASLRLFAGLLFAGLLIVACRLIRPTVLYWLACANLGNYWRAELVNQALRERHPDLLPLQDSRLPQSYGVWSTSTSAQRWAFLAIYAYIESRLDSSCTLLNRDLDPVTSIRCGSAYTSIQPGDRNGDESVEAVFSMMMTVPSLESASALIELGSPRHKLIAIVAQARTTTMPAFMVTPNWTDNERDGKHELTWLTFAPTPAGVARVQPVFGLRWLAPGQMTLEGTLPPGYKLWLAGEKVDVTFTPDQPLDEVVRRVLEQQP